MCRRGSMDELLLELKHLSANVKNESEESSSTLGPNPTAGIKKSGKKRQKKNQKKNNGRKRQHKRIPDVDLESSSYTDCTDEDILHDYIDNILVQCNRSDAEDTILHQGAFLVNKPDFTSMHDYRIPAHQELDETDSYTENLRLASTRKKRRKYKRHSSVEEAASNPNQQITDTQKQNIMNVLSKQYATHSRSPNLHITHFKNEDSDEVMDSPDINASSDNSGDSSSGSDADDEGEESCVEGVNDIIPWWDDNHMHVDDKLVEQSIIDLGLSDMDKKLGVSSRLYQKAQLKVVSESGGFIAYINHKMKAFVHQRDATELSVFPANSKEQAQVNQLAYLYNLNCTDENSGRSNKVVLTKTMMTKGVDPSALKSFLTSEVKLKCRKVQVNPQKGSKRRKTEKAPSEVPIPDTNIGNKLLRSMGWSPGQGLGKDGVGIVQPLKATKRPRNLGFGHPMPDHYKF